jgi:predicted Zn-dependent protease
MIKAILVKAGTQEKISVDLLVSLNQLEIFLGPTQLLSFSPRSASCELGGNNQSLVFLRAPEMKDDILYFEATGENLKELKKSTLFLEQSEKISSQKNKERAMGALILFSVLAVLSLLFVYRGPIFGSIGEKIPLAWEKALADQVFKSKRTAEQLEIEKKLLTMVEPLLAVDPVWKEKMTFHLSSSTDLNAYATIGGHIFINKGLVVQLQTEEQLLGVIAHEIQHVKKRHVSRSVAQALGLYGLIQLLVGDVTGIAAVFIDQGGALAQLQYSRELEEEADREALKELQQAKIRSLGLAEALEIIFEQNKKVISQTAAGEIAEKLQKIELLSSHPETEKRIANLKIAAEATRDLPEKNREFFQEFQQQVKERF